MKALRVSVLLCMMAAVAQADLADDARDALRRATDFMQRKLSVHGGYAGIYSLDLQMRYGEAMYEPALAHDIWIQPPGTPTVGEVLLRAHHVTGDERYRDMARAAGLALAWGQSKAGGWDHRANLVHFDPDSPPKRRNRHGAFDDNITQGALTFLMTLDQQIDEPWLDDTIRRAIDHMLEAQFDNGAWPQWYPLRGGYHDYYTFNDRAINDCIRVMLEAHEHYGDQTYLDSALRGGDFVITSQMAKPQSGWAQQYSHDMKPAKARRFEPAAVCSAVTTRNIRTLIDLYLYTDDDRFLGPIPAAIDWLEASAIDDDRWARLYEVGSNRPIYGDRDGDVHYALDDISEERRLGYAWEGGFGVRSVIRQYEQLMERGRDAIREARAAPRTYSAESTAPRARAAVESLDGQGRWVRDGMIHIRDYVRHIRDLCDYLEAVE